MSAKHEINVGFKFPEKKGGEGKEEKWPVALAFRSGRSLLPFLKSKEDIL